MSVRKAVAWLHKNRRYREDVAALREVVNSDLTKVLDRLLEIIDAEPGDLQTQSTSKTDHPRSSTKGSTRSKKPDLDAVRTAIAETDSIANVQRVLNAHNLTVPDLKVLARDFGVTGYSKMKKPELMDAIGIAIVDRDTIETMLRAEH